MTAAEAGARIVRVANASFSYLDAGSGPPLVLLARHRIGRRIVLLPAGDPVRSISGGRLGCTWVWRFDTACDRASLRE
jgi:hypothetical protein